MEATVAEAGREWRSASRAAARSQPAQPQLLNSTGPGGCFGVALRWPHPTRAWASSACICAAKASALALLREATQTLPHAESVDEGLSVRQALHPAPTMSKGSCGTCASRWVASSDAAPVRLAVAVRP